MGETTTIGIVYQVQPEPPDAANCQWLEAGAVRFGLEYREVDPEKLAAAYAGSREDLAEIAAHSPEGGFSDTGVSIHVVGSADDHEYLRFDAFDDDPHYHYVRPTGDHNHWVPFDAVAGGDMLAFAFHCLRERLGEMLIQAGGRSVADALDAGQQLPVIEQLERQAFQVRDEHRSSVRAATGNNP